MTPETLDGAKSEAEEVAQSFESKPLTGKEATREAVLSCLPSADLVHFACHGSWQYKALLLAPSVERPLDGYTEEHVLLTAGKRAMFLCCSFNPQGQTSFVVKGEGRGMIGIVGDPVS